MKNQNNNPLKLDSNKDIKNETKSISLNPKFESLQHPDILLNHVKELTKSKATAHNEILNQLIEQFEPLDFEEMANPKKVENFKLSYKHYTVLSVENALQVADKNRWGLCKNHNFIYLFNGTFWNQIDKETFQKFLGEASEKMGVPKFTARYYENREKLYKQFLATAYLPTPEADKNTVLINLQNGTFEINKKGTALRPFDSKDFITYQLPFEYEPKAKSPLFETYLNKVLPDKDRQKVLAEYLGFIFIKHGSNRLKEEKALILYGTGANGKSVFFEVVSALLGSENTSNYSLQNLTEEKGFYRARFKGKLVNYASEINGKLETSIFKAMVSGEPVEACLKYGQPFTMTDYPKFIFNCNELPKDVEHTNAYFRRFLIVPFDVTIPPQEQDKQLHAKIIESELSGVFNWVLEGLNRLLIQGRFTECEAVKNAVEQYKAESNSVQMFLTDCDYSSNANEYQKIVDLYREYKEYCIEDGNKPFKKSNFIKQLRGLNIVVDKINVGNVAYLLSNRNTF